MKKLRDFRITGEVNHSHVVQSYDSRKDSGAFHYHVIIEHFDLNICTLYAVITVGNGVDYQFFPYEFGIFRHCHKSSVTAEVGVFLHLTSHKFYGFLNHLKNGSCENDVLDDVHLCADFRFCTFITDKPHTRTFEEPLRILAKKKNGSSAHFFPSAFCYNKFLVLANVFISGFWITDLLAVC